MGRTIRARNASHIALLVFILVFAQFVLAQPTPSWMQLNPSGGPPTARARFAYVHDTANNRMTIFGGGTLGGLVNDVWVLSNANGLGGTPAWTQLNPGGGPSPRMGNPAVYNPGANRMTLFGGFTGGCGESNEVWVLSNANGLGGAPAWTQLNPPGTTPPVTAAHSAVYDVTGNRMIVFGGNQNSACNPPGNAVWVLGNADGTGGTPAWSQLAPAGAAPGGRALPSAVYDAATNRMIVFGGEMFGGYFNDVWVLSNANGVGGTPTWIQLAPGGGPPSARSGHTAVYDPATNRMIVFGGGNFISGPPVNNEVWMLSNANGLGGTPMWSQLMPVGGPPAARTQHSAVYHHASNRMTVFAGSPPAGMPFNDTWVLTDVIVIVVQIDIKPGSFPNSINLAAGGVTPVAILTTTTPSFNAASVNVGTVQFAGAIPLRSALEDVDGDGDLDRVLHFDTQALNLTCASTQATLTGQTNTGTPIQGTDSVRIVRAKNGQICL